MRVSGPGANARVGFTPMNRPLEILPVVVEFLVGAV